MNKFSTILLNFSLLDKGGYNGVDNGQIITIDDIISTKITDENLTKWLAIIVQKCTELYGTFSNQWNLRKSCSLELFEYFQYGIVRLCKFGTRESLRSGHDKTKWHLKYLE